MSEAYIRPEQHETSTAARKILAAALPDSWVDRLDVGSDYGIDDHIEIFKDGFSTGLMLLVQRKGFSERPGPEVTHLIYDLPVKTLHYAELFSPPVLLALVPVALTRPQFHYLWLQEYIRVVLDHENPAWRSNKSTVRVRIPAENRMPGTESRLTYIAAAPRRDMEWAKAARISHELEYVIDASDWSSAAALIDELYGLTSLFGDAEWATAAWARPVVLNPALVAVHLLQRGGPYSVSEAAEAGIGFQPPPNGLVDEQELLTFVLTSRVRLFPNQVMAALSTAYDTAAARTIQRHFGTHSY